MTKQPLGDEYKTLAEILLSITSLDSDFSLAEVADLVDKGRFYWSDTFERVSTLTAEAKSDVYDILTRHRRMLAHKEYRGPLWDIDIWKRYEKELHGGIISPDKNGLFPLMYRVWTKSKYIDRKKSTAKSNNVLSQRAGVIRDWVKQHSEAELQKQNKLEAWNTIFNPIAPDLFNRTASLGDNCKVSKAFRAAGVEFKPGRPSRK